MNKAKTFGITDEKIKQAVVNEMAWDNRVDASRVTVKVSRKLVTLAGEVLSRSARVAAEEAAWNIKGVSYVNNHLSVTDGNKMRGIVG